MQCIRISVVAAVALAALAGTAEAKRHSYIGAHPIAVSAGGGYCHIDAGHVHVYAPDHADTLFRVSGGAYLFVGDPSPFGYDGPRYTYFGHHEVPVDGHFCYLDGAHYHAFQPAVTADFKLQGGAYFYVGDYPKAYRVNRKKRDRIDHVYAELDYMPPVVAVAPPVEYVGPPVIEASVVVSAPPPPAVHLSAGIDIGFPVVVVDGHHHHHHDVVIVGGRRHKHKHWRKHRKHRGKWRRRHRGWDDDD
jgi:hypothetical protein